MRANSDGPRGFISWDCSQGDNVGTARSRQDFDASQVRAWQRGLRMALSPTASGLAAIYDGATRTEATKMAALVESAGRSGCCDGHGVNFRYGSPWWMVWPEQHPCQLKTQQNKIKPKCSGCWANFKSRQVLPRSFRLRAARLRAAWIGQPTGDPLTSVCCQM